MGLAGLSVAALGVVFGDVGTSPVYTFREFFNPDYGFPVDTEHVLGVLSMIFWALIIVVAVKYVLLIMRADNHGEGGILALLALALEAARGERSRNLLVLLALGGGALFYGDSMITPAISVLSAVEGISIATPVLNHFVLPLTIVVLLALFFFQKGGTGRVGRLFGPVMVLWFAILAVNGVLQISEAPRVLAALNPAHAVGIFVAAPAAGFVVLGAVALAITGGEALYADMGHFGRLPIRPCVVRPGPELFRTGRPDPRRPIGNREPILPHGAGLELVPTGAAVDCGDGYRVAGGDLRSILVVAASDPARPDAAARSFPDLDQCAGSDLHPAG
jgi:KUP system potassium uptake protein